ncbi:MAG TPA: hypothetical protein P5274_02945 [Candidatus Paceibacterota bacterium]|nr:hypothetical protein [Candidatus Paceibacterota bacterium]
MLFRLIFVTCLVGLVALFTAWLMFVFDLEVTMSNVAMVSYPLFLITALVALVFVVTFTLFVSFRALLQKGIQEEEV